jgi:hypothetical protein
MKTPPRSIEPLELRIAPASLTFTDVDGDKVVITTTGPGVLTLGGNVTVTGGQLQTLDLTGAKFQGANVKIVARRDPVLGGDGFVNVGRIEATGRDLGTVLVDGDLGRIVAGDLRIATAGVKALSVVSLGLFGTDTGALNLTSSIRGKLGSLIVRTDVLDAHVSADSIGPITVGGSVLFASLFSRGDIGLVKIGGDLRGGDETNRGQISSQGHIAGVAIGGSFVGGSLGGTISSSGDLGPVKIGRDLVGGGNFINNIPTGTIQRGELDRRRLDPRRPHQWQRQRARRRRPGSGENRAGPARERPKHGEDYCRRQAGWGDDWRIGSRFERV